MGLTILKHYVLTLSKSGTPKILETSVFVIDLYGFFLTFTHIGLEFLDKNGKRN